MNSTDSARCSGPDEKIPPPPGTNQMAGFVEFRPLTSRNKNMAFLVLYWLYKDFMVYFYGGLKSLDAFRCLTDIAFHS